MTWTKLSDDFGDDCDGLSDAAFRLHVEGIIWSNRKLLDCRIPKAHLRRFATHPESLPELYAVGWWSDDGDDMVIRHHAGYQKTRDEVLKQQEANRQNGRRGGRPRKPPREQALPSETQSVSESLTDSSSYSTTHRDGTGRDRLSTGSGTNNGAAINEFGVGHCAVCPAFEKLGPDGLCSSCAVEAAVSARAAS